MSSTFFHIRRRAPRPAPSLDDYLRRRKLKRRLLVPGVVAMLAATSWADHRGLFLYPGEDMGSFNGQWLTVREVLGGDTLLVAASPPARVRLCGLAPLHDDRRGLRRAALRFIRQRCLGRRVRLHLDPRRTRHVSGELLAYVEMADGSLLNERLLSAGLCMAAEAPTHPRGGSFELLEAQARHDGVGLWAAAR